MPDKPEKPMPPAGYIFERRRFVRIDGTFVVSYTDVTSKEIKSDITQTKNISAGGVLFTTDRKFPAGTILKLKLRLPDAPDYIDVRVKVVDSKQRVKGLLYDTRLRFIRISEENKAFIKRMVEYYIQERKKT